MKKRRKTISMWIASIMLASSLVMPVGATPIDELNPIEPEFYTDYVGEEVINGAYTRATLEEAFGEDAAGKIRAIMLNQQLPMEADGLEEADIENAIQSALKNCVADEGVNDSLTEALLALEPMGPVAQTSGTVAIEDCKPSRWTLNEGGTYTATVEANVKAEMTTPIDLAVSAALKADAENCKASMEILADAWTDSDVQAVTLNITGIPAELAYTEITLRVEGAETGEADVFVFSAEDEMIVGIADAILPISAEVTIYPNLELEIDSFVMVGEEGSETKLPLSDLAYDVYRQEGSEKTLVTTLTTGADGKACVDLSSLGQAAGEFVIVGKEHDALSELAGPISVTLPYEANGIKFYKVTKSIERQAKESEPLGVAVDVTELNKKSASVAVGKAFTYIISADIPADVTWGSGFAVSDTFDYRLSYAGNDTVVVKVVSTEGAVTLEKGTHYLLNVATYTVTVDGTPETVTTVTVELTDAGRTKIAQTIGTAAFDSYKLLVYVGAFLDEDAASGTQVPNGASVTYTNMLGSELDTEVAEADMAYVSTSSFRIFNFDALEPTKPLKGATFKLARVATTEEIAAGESKSLVVNGTAIDVVYENFYTANPLTEELFYQGTVKTADVGADGYAAIFGIPEGTYYLVESKAPEGYHLLDEPIPVNLAGRAGDYLVSVPNSMNFDLPPTGGIGTWIFTLGGAALIGAAIVVLVLNKKKENG